MPTSNLVASTTVALFSICSGASAQTLRCDITSKFVCESSGCQPTKPSVFNILDLDSRTIARCDSQGCKPTMR